VREEGENETKCKSRRKLSGGSDDMPLGADRLLAHALLGPKPVKTDTPVDAAHMGVVSRVKSDTRAPVFTEDAAIFLNFL